MIIHCIVRRRLAEAVYDRQVRCTVKKLSDAHDAAALEMGMRSWEIYTSYCGPEAHPVLLSISVLSGM